jgi:Yip1 domain
MTIIDRVKAILLTPKTEWPVIAGETGDVAGIYKKYLIYLAAIPALARFIGFSIIGIGALGVSYRVPFFSGLLSAVVGYVLSLAMLYVMSLIVDALAPTFGGQKSQINAFKLVAYGSTAAMVAGIFSMIPGLRLLGILGLYSIYLIYLGLPVMMKCPQEKALTYTAVLIVCGIVAGIVLGAVMAWITPGPGRMMTGDAGSVSIRTPNGEVNVNTKALDVLAKKMEEASKNMEAASKSNDPAASGKAVGEVLAAMSGAAGGREPIASQDLKAMLPEALGDLKRESYEAQGGAALGMKGSSAKAEFRNGDQSVHLEITDLGSLAGLAGMAGWMNVTSDKETATETEKVYKEGSRTVKERVSKSDKSAEFSVILESGVIVEARGRGVEIGALKQIVEGLDLGKLESVKSKG